LIHGTIIHWFRAVTGQLGWRQPGDRRGPRLHDLRHHFSIQTLVRWSRSPTDVEVHLPDLSTYLGHVHVRDTYWYLSATPELLKLATRRCQRKEIQR
jgi:integrase/recombinase XerD